MHEVGDLVVRLIADIREFMGKFDEAEAKVGEFATVSEKSSTRFGKAMSKMSTAVVGAGAVIAGYGLHAAYEYGKAIEKIGFQSGASEKEIDRLKKRILDLSVATATSATELANSYVLIEQAGFRRAKADEIAINAAKLAKLTNTDLATSTKDLIAVQALQLNGSKSAAETTAMLVELNRNHVGTLEDLSNLFGGKLSATMKTFGISTASAGAGIEAITKHGIAANVATQGLTVGMTKLLTPSAKIDKSLHAIGLSQRRIADDLHKPNGLFVALSDMKTHLIAAGVPAKDFGGYISSLAGARGAAGLGVMMQYLDDMKKAYPDLLNSQKKFDEAWAKFQQTPEFKFDKLKSEFNKAMIQVGNVILPVAIDVANAFLNAQKYFDEHPLISKVAIDTAIGILSVGVGMKLAGWGIEIAKSFGVEAALTANTGPIGVAIAIAMYSAWSVLNSKELPKTSLGYWVNKLLGLKPTSQGSDTKVVNGKTMIGEFVNLLKMEPGKTYTNSPQKYITQAQDTALMNFINSKAFLKLTPAQQNTEYQNALKNFASGDLRGNYSVTINVK